MEPSPSSNHQVAVLIDYENAGLSSIQWLFDKLSEIGRIIVKRAYGDWSLESGKRDQLLQLGVEPIQVFRSIQGKNSSDIRLVIDAVELMYQSPVDTFVIVSSDSDFVSLVSKLRAAGKTVIGAGRQAAVTKTLVLSCDRYYYLDQSETPQAADSAGPQKAISLLTRAVEASIDSEGKVLGSKLHQTIQRMDPSFDYKAEGFSTWTKFLQNRPEVKVSRPKDGGDVAVELAESDAAPQDAEWDIKIDAAWSKRVTKTRTFLPGSTAAAEAARILGVPKLSASKYRTLQGLISQSNHLQGKWSSEKNRVAPRPPAVA